MMNPFKWYHSLYYGEKWNLSDFDTKNPQSLDYLLKQMYMLGHKNGYLVMKNSLPAFNAAYYVAVALANTEGIDETNMWGEINSSIRTICFEDFLRNHKNASTSNQNYCPLAELMLIKWMVYAILWLQENKTEEMESFLNEFWNDMKGLTPYDDDPNDKFMLKDRFLEKLPMMISAWEYRYNTNLTPHPLHPQYYKDYMWGKHVSEYDMNDMIWQLSFFPTTKEQHAFLDWAKEMSDKYRYDDNEDLPF